ncbi:MAG: GGDEF domain-containing protein [Candidatus Nanopelagicales bacterium]
MSSGTPGRGAGAGRPLLAAALVALLVVPVVVLDPDSGWGYGLALGVEVLAALVLAVAAARCRTDARTVWWLLFATVALTVLGDAIYDWQLYGIGEAPFPGWADPVYFASYVTEVAALVLLVRSRHPHRDWAQWLDSAIIAAPLAAVVGVFVLLPLAEAGSWDSATVVSLLYPLFDVVVLTGLIRMLVGGGSLSRSLTLVTVSVSVTLLADLLYNGLAAEGLVEEMPGWMNALFSLGTVLMALAALTSDASDIRRPSHDSGRIISPPRAVALGLGTMALPVLIALGVRGDVDSGVRILAAASILVNALVVWRAVLLLGIVVEQKAELARVARTDALTGLPNRRSWDFELDRAVAFADSSGRALTLAVIDLDGFKEFNDEHGHPAGDALLESCARRWRDVLPAVAYLARYGGDEFTLLLPEVDVDIVRQSLEMLRRSTPLPVTVSIGYAVHRFGDTGAQTFEDADAAMYVAKDRGRNQVVALDEVVTA